MQRRFDVGLGMDSHARSAITRTMTLGTLLNLSEGFITLPWNAAGVSKRGDSFSEQERSMCLGPSKRDFTLACSQGLWPVDERGCLPYWTGPRVSQKNALDCPLEHQEAEGTQGAREVCLFKSLLKAQPKGNCISTLKGFLGFFKNQMERSRL